MMRKLILYLAVLAAVLAGSSVRADQADINAAARSVVRVVLIGVRGDRVFLIGHGTGLAINRSHVLTNAHVVADALEYENIALGVIPPEGRQRWIARVKAYAPSKDLALLELDEGGGLEPMTFFTGPVEDGAKIVAIGYPGAVDRGQGLNARDIITPMSPVKSPGTLTGGRSAKAFDTVLHDAPIGSGNSGGPLVDECGRVLGVNSFGSVGGEIDSEFYFAVSTGEVMRFLSEEGIRPSKTGERCRTMEELERIAAQKQQEARDREAAAQAERDRARDLALRQAREDISEDRENAMALAAILLAAAVLGGVAALAFGQKEGNRRPTMIVGGVGLLFFAGAVAVWLTRPSLSDAEEAAASDNSEESRVEPGGHMGASGELVCVLDEANSRITVSSPTDVPFDWRDDGCVNGRTQYALVDRRWERILVPAQDQTVTIAAFDPESRTYSTERYLLDFETMEQLRGMRKEMPTPACGSEREVAISFGQSQQGIRSLLPDRPNEKLVYNCRTRP